MRFRIAQARGLGPNDGLIVPALERYGLSTYVAVGQEIDVPDQLAGRRAEWRRASDEELSRAAVDGHDDLRDNDGVIEIHDLGAGFLAQPDVWEVIDGGEQD